FDRSFPCPACGPDFEVNGPEEWSNHTARFHGPKYTPGLPDPKCRAIQDKARKPQESRSRSARCLVCETNHYPGNSHSRHFNKSHAWMFKDGFPCPECERQGLGKVMIVDHSSWMKHCKKVHSLDGQTGALVHIESDAKRKLELTEDHGNAPIPFPKRIKV
ncbi:hypothetical protein QBC35DRAFT_392364, partial [Podospora australis]